jgi:hypothetical protein
MPTGRAKISAMRNRLLPAVAGSVVLSATIAAVLVSGSASGSAQRAPQTLQLTQLDRDFTYVDAPPKAGDNKPPSGGDELVIGGKIAEGGSTSIVCTVTHPGARAAGICIGVLELAGGEITFVGGGSLAGNTTTSAVTGGTGEYAGASGTLTSKSSNSSGRTTLTVSLD